MIRAQSQIASGGSGSLLPPYQFSTSQTFGATFNGQLIDYTGAAAGTATLAQDAVPGTTINWIQSGVGALFFAPQNATPLQHAQDTAAQAAGQYSMGTAICRSNANGLTQAVWALVGDLIPTNYVIWPVNGQVVITGTTRTIGVGDNGGFLVFTSDLPVSITLPADVTITMICTLLQAGAGQLTILEGAGADVECGLDQAGALHRKSAYRGGPMTAHMNSNVGGAAAHWWIYGATSPD